MHEASIKLLDAATSAILDHAYSIDGVYLSGRSPQGSCTSERLAATIRRSLTDLLQKNIRRSRSERPRREKWTRLLINSRTEGGVTHS